MLKSGSPLYLFVILLLALVASMVFGYHYAAEGKKRITTATTLMEGAANMTSTVKMGQKDVVLVTKVRVAGGKDLHVLLDAADEKASFSLLLTDDPNLQTAGDAYSYDGKKTAQPSLSAPPATASSTWLLPLDNMTIVYSFQQPFLCNVVVFDNDNNVMSRLSTFRVDKKKIPGDYGVGINVVTDMPKVVKASEDMVGASILQNMNNITRIPGELIITDTFRVQSYTDKSVSYLFDSWKIGNTVGRGEDKKKSFYVEAKDANVLMLSSVTIDHAKEESLESLTIIILDKTLTDIKHAVNFRNLMSFDALGLGDEEKEGGGSDRRRDSGGSDRRRDSGGSDYGSIGYGGNGYQRGPFDQGPMVPIYMCAKFNADGSCAQFSGQNGSSASNGTVAPPPAPASAPAPATGGDSRASDPNSVGGVTNNVVDRGSSLASQVVSDATGLAVGAGLGAGMLAAGAGTLAKDAGSGAKDMLEDAGTGASDLLQSAGSGAYGLAQGVGGGVDKVITGVGKGIAGVGNELAYLANTAIQGGQGQGQGQGQGGFAPAQAGQAYTAINAVGPAYITGYSNNMAACQIPSIYNYYGAQALPTTPTMSTVMPMPSSLDKIQYGAGAFG